MVLGSPRQRDVEPGADAREAFQRAADGLEEVARVGAECDVKLLLEPLHPEETNFLQSVEEALELRDAIGQRAGPYLELPEGLPVSQLADLLIMHLKLPPETMSELFNLQEVSARARRALNEHESQAA